MIKTRIGGYVYDSEGYIPVTSNLLRSKYNITEEDVKQFITANPISGVSNGEVQKLVDRICKGGDSLITLPDGCEAFYIIYIENMINGIIEVKEIHKEIDKV